VTDHLIPDDVARLQISASDPAASAWVAANAGSGKTYVLAQRVIRLLLDGAEPAKVLCLTFTKAASANMANQVFATLARWATLADAELDDALGRMEGRPPSPARRRRARQLFAEALETPGGLKVQTIHAFCASLLHQFPFEAGVAARFEVLDERAEGELIERLRLEVLLEAAAQSDGALGRALAAAIPAAADATFADVVREAIGQRDQLQGWLDRAGDAARAVAELADLLGIAADDSVERVEADFLASPVLPRTDWAALAAALAAGADSDKKHVARLARAGAGNAWTNIAAYLQIFCTAEFAPRQQIVTKAVRDAHPDLFAALTAEQQRVCALLERRRAILARDRTAALVTIADAVIGRYRAEKARRGLLDYDDLIGKTLELMTRVDAAWVHYKLDLGVDHVLIDEAQDTSPKQWEVIRALTAEFFAGAGAREGARRSIFAVGDEKQSIYSFQGAAPHRFDEMRRHFEQAHGEAGIAFKPLRFKYSFRSAPDVLEAVDAVFARPQAYEGLTADPVATVHEAVRRTAPGCVEIWPLIEADKLPDGEGWDAAFDTVSETSPQVRLARRIAETVRTWIARGMRLPATGAAVKPGDVLVLVRQRGPLFEAVIRALKDAAIEVAGADRLVLTEHVAVMDLMSLADALLLEDDDLALAETLKSPLFGIDDRQLFALAWGRQGSLRAALRAKAAEGLPWARAAAALDGLAAKARAQTPFAFYAGLLGAGEGRKRMLARLGLEAADALDEFLALALEYQRRQTPSLQGFVAWLRAARTEVKRDMDIARDEVRVMTVHGAKGLEAPIVVLADTTTRPGGPRDPRLLTLEAPALPAHAPRPLVWAGAKDTDAPCVAKAREVARRAAAAEHRRLLYVAMTRAADRLIVCGAQGVQARPQGCWYDLVHDALAPRAREEPAHDGAGTVWRWQKSGASEPPQSRPQPQAESMALPMLPAWLTRDAPAEGTLPALSPSVGLDADADIRGMPRGIGGPEAARRKVLRGRLMHRLLQALPEVAREQRADAARRHLARHGKGLEPAEIEETVAEVLAVLHHPEFAELFAPGSRAEVPIVGRLTRAVGAPTLVSGQIDRLAVTPSHVLIADYKTDRAPPRRLDNVPQDYVLQLALYGAVLARLYPGRGVRAALVWTQTPQLMELPGPVLDDALVHVGVSRLDAVAAHS
jgi:ATP-dependent helicase/nuclease subunit A